MFFFKATTSALLCLTLSAVAQLSQAVSFRKIVNFGDSTSDTGNGAAVLTANSDGPVIPSDAYWQGRFSNGPTYIEYVAKNLNAVLDSHAVGGATTSDALIQGWLGGKFGEPFRNNGSIFPVPGVDTQIKNYLASPEPEDKSHILYTIWACGNDNIDNGILQLNKTGDFYAKAQFPSWVHLAEAGAKNIMVVVPPPQTLFDIQYGLELHAQAVKFSFLHPFVKFGLFELPVVFAGLLVDPSAFGISHGKDEHCCAGNCFSGLPPAGNATPCVDPQNWMVWDEIHPTAHVHKIIGDDATAFIKGWWGLLSII